MNYLRSLWSRWKHVLNPNALNVFCTVVISAATVWYAITAKHQLDTMNRQLQAMASSSTQTDNLVVATQNLASAAKLQADAAKSQAGSMKDIADRALIQSQAANRLAAESKRSADIAESQGPSPWVGIERDSFKLEGPRYEWSGPNAPTIRFEAQFSVKNLGTAPALHFIARMNSVPVQWDNSSGGSIATFPVWENDKTVNNRVCPLIDSETAVAGYRKEGSVVLPGETRGARAGSSIPEDVKPRALGFLWTTLCITYFGPNGTVHHSGYGFMSNPSGPAVPSVGGTITYNLTNFPEHPGWGFTPLSPAVLAQSNAN